MKPSQMTWGTYVRVGLGRRLSMLGERLNIHWLTYNPIHFKHFHEHALANSPGVMRTLAAVFPNARRYLDVGSGSGAFAAAAKRQGREVVACEHSPTGRRMAARQGVDCRPFDLARDPAAEIDDNFDLSYCFEVAEHLPPVLGTRLVRFIAARAPTAVFTAAHPGQGGTGHINEQPKEHWVAQFADAGMVYSPELSGRVRDGFAREAVAQYLIDNVIVLTRPPLPAGKANP